MRKRFSPFLPQKRGTNLLRFKTNGFQTTEFKFKKLDTLVLGKAAESALERQSFGWALYLSDDSKYLQVTIVEPRHKYESEYKNYIRFT